MMFINLVLCDLRSGILKQWRVYLTVFLLFSVVTGFAFLDFVAALRMEPSPLNLPVTLGDCLCFIFGGTSTSQSLFRIESATVVNSMFEFNFPSIWVLTYLVLLLITLSYPYDDLMGFGKHMIILSRKIHAWWFSKCIWIAVSTVVYFSVIFLAVSVVSLLMGAEYSFQVGPYYPYYRFNAAEYVTNPPWSILPVVLMVIPTGIGLCSLQLLFSLITTRIISYLLTSAFLLISAMFQHFLLFPNVTIAARNIVFVSNGQEAFLELLVIFWICSLCTLIGYLRLKHMDILNKVK